MNYPNSLQQLIDSFRALPGVGEKTAERYALAVVDMDQETALHFSESIKNVKEKLKHCEECGNLTENDTCEICSDPDRDHSTIFVVQSSKDIQAMERTREYNGVYHVLNGLISTSKGIMPEDLNIDSLIKRAHQAKEVILGTNTTMDGETTAMYLDKLLHRECPDILVTRIAHGLPSGGMLDYADEMTLTHALSDRRKM